MIRGVGPWGHYAVVPARRPKLDGGARQHACTVVSVGTGLAPSARWPPGLTVRNWPDPELRRQMTCRTRWLAGTIAATLLVGIVAAGLWIKFSESAQVHALLRL